MRRWMQNFCDIVGWHPDWRLVGWFCGFKVYRCTRCGGLLQEQE